MATKVKSINEFVQVLKDCGNGLLLVHFAATWAPQCKQIDGVIEELAKEYVHVKFVHVEAEELVSLSEKYNVTSVPTMVFFKNEKEIERIAGANVPELTKKVQHHSSTFVAPITSADQVESKESINDKLKRLINRSPTMLFMKGSPQQPRCGFSKQILQALSGYKFGSFDILSDDEVRQGLKTYSNWPTYPQLYVNGELVGGVDIVKELAESGELAGILAEAKEEDLDTRLHKLLNSSQVMLIMKGSPQEPRCGFSRQMCQVLENYPSVKFSSFDILNDQEVREGIKVYSKWPTFPQLYVGGELIGGIDIAKIMEGELDRKLTKPETMFAQLAMELHESGELESILSPEES